MTATELRNEVAFLDAVPSDKGWDADKLGIALATYYIKHPSRPADDNDDTELGWGKWVMAQTNDMLDRIAAKVRDVVKAEAEEEKRQRIIQAGCGINQ